MSTCEGDFRHVQTFFSYNKVIYDYLYELYDMAPDIPGWIRDLQEYIPNYNILSMKYCRDTSIPSVLEVKEDPIRVQRKRAADMTNWKIMFKMRITG